MNKIILTLLFSITIFAQFSAPSIPAQNQKICIKSLCDKLGYWGCRDDQGLSTVTDACTRQLDINCLTISLNKLPTFSTNDLDEVVSVARSCHYVDAQAISFASRELGRFDIDELNEVTRLNDSLWLAEPSCILTLLSHVSKYDKDDLNEVENLAKNCTGNFDRNCFNRICNGPRSNCDELSKVKSAIRSCLTSPSKVDRRKL